MKFRKNFSIGTDIDMMVRIANNLNHKLECIIDLCLQVPNLIFVFFIESFFVQKARLCYTCYE